jgi:hypothetical protein
MPSCSIACWEVCAATSSSKECVPDSPRSRVSFQLKHDKSCCLHSLLSGLASLARLPCCARALHRSSTAGRNSDRALTAGSHLKLQNDDKVSIVCCKLELQRALFAAREGFPPMGWWQPTSGRGGQLGTPAHDHRNHMVTTLPSYLMS